MLLIETLDIERERHSQRQQRGTIVADFVRLNAVKERQDRGEHVAKLATVAAGDAVEGIAQWTAAVAS